MIIPLRTDSPLRTTPFMNWAIIAVNVLVFMVTMTNPHLADAYTLSVRQPRLYQFFTSQFLHASWMHITGNMLFLYIFGNNINDRLGHIGYLSLYLAGGVFAGISFLITSSGDSLGLLGASGAIAAVTGAYMALLPRSNVTVFFFFWYIGVYEIASVWFIAGFFAYDIYLNAMGRDGVAHMAHVGGTIYGFLICLALLALHLLPRDPFDVVSMIQRWNRRRQYRDMVAGGYNPWEYSQGSRSPRYGSSAPPAPPDARTGRILDLRGEIADALAGRDADRAAKLYQDLKAIDPGQVLSRQQQLDVANHLAHQQLYPQAAEAYEIFLRTYPKSDGQAQVELMLGLIYARYLNQPDRAREYLTRAAEKYHTGRELELAREELAHLPAK